MEKNNQNVSSIFKGRSMSQMNKLCFLSLLFIFPCIMTAQNSKAPWLEGSWGPRLVIRAGSELNHYIDNLDYDYVAYARQINQNYPTAGHVITNFTANANGAEFTLRQNDNVDVANEIDPTIVPSLESEQMVIDAIKELKNGGKKVILYLNVTVNLYRGTESQRENWYTYVGANFNGDHFAAYRHLCEGFVKRFKGLVDGYWLDNLSQGTDEQKGEFMQMIRNADPNVVIAANNKKSYFPSMYVDSDGTNDADDTNYRIIKYQANELWSDLTAGHMTPLSNGAPPNSWAYEEYTLTDMVADNLSDFSSNNNVLKHMFTPMRETWSSYSQPLVFADNDQAYRFVKRITGAGGAITFSTTTGPNGLAMPDELAILKYVNDQFEANADYVPYVRPEGAFLVGETKPNYHQGIDFHDIENKEVGDTDFFPFAYASSGAAVTLTSSNTNVARIVNNKIRIVGPGNTNITASQNGNSTFAAAESITKQLTVTTGGGGTTNDGNLALDGAAAQSTTAYSGDASRAIDGNTDGKWSNNSVTHTASGTAGAWWQVRLAETTNIGDIKIFNRTDSCCSDRLSNFTVKIGDGNGNWVFSKTYTTTPNPSMTIDAE
ncbi:discoidin domain-containing protein, partial [Aquimarina addita]|uniref:galactose-binding domain-containing protein n=1 Tax=Aquimarina addita TaxID=870485 RepID=UPI0031EB9B1B